MKILLPLLAVLALGACSHSEVKAPCGPTASLSGKSDPCARYPINVAALHGADKERPS
jgi:hypothetical protein